MILAIDIGNTNIVIGCCADGQVIFRERVSTNPTATVLEYAAMLKMAFDMNREDITAVDGAILSSVVPAVTLTMRDAVHKYLHLTPLVVGPASKPACASTSIIPPSSAATLSWTPSRASTTIPSRRSSSIWVPPPPSPFWMRRADTAAA